MSEANQGTGAERIFGQVDPDAMKVVRRLLAAGHEAYLVGGCVRDLYLGHQPKDFDIATSATPEAIRKLFRNSRVIGRRFKLVHVFFGSKIIETSTFRTAPLQDDDDPLITHDNEWGSVEDDARRRDFTINGLFYDVETRRIVDFVDGMDDLDRAVVRTIGDPELRFREDPVRMIRAVKFAARLDCHIEDATWQALLDVAPDIVRSSRARLLEEIYKLLRSGASRRCFELLLESGMLHRIMPDYTKQFGGRDEGIAALRAGHAALDGELEAARASAQAPSDAPDASAKADPAPTPEASAQAPDQAVSAADDAQGTDAAAAAAAEPTTDPPDTPSPGNGSDDAPVIADSSDAADSSDPAPPSPDPTGRQPATLLWRHLDALDDYVRKTRADVVNGVLQAVLFAPLVHDEMIDGSRQTLDRAIDRVMAPVASSFGVARRDRELARQILMAHRRMTDQRSRRRRRGSLAQRQYFHDALIFLGISVRATGGRGPELPLWTALAAAQREGPKPGRGGAGDDGGTGSRKRSRRRRGGRRNKKQDGPGREAAPSQDG